MDFWSKVLIEIEKIISKPSFETWFKSTTAKLEDGVIVVYSKNIFASDWLEERYKSLIFEMVREVTGKTYNIDFTSEDVEVNSKSTYEKDNSVGAECYREGISVKITEIYNILEVQEQRISRLEKLLLVNKSCASMNEKVTSQNPNKSKKLDDLLDEISSENIHSEIVHFDEDAVLTEEEMKLIVKARKEYERG